MQETVPTDKPRFQAYLTPELMQKAIEYCSLENCSQSELGVTALTRFFNENYVGSELTPEQIKQLQAIAEKNYRPVTDQVRMFIIQGIKNSLEQQND